MNTINYVTVIEPVYESTLVGTADLAPWQHLLASEGLPIASTNGRAELLLSAVDSKYKGIRFQEFSISIKVSDTRYFLAHAYNSIGLFALAERKMFRTPYYQGTIHVEQRQIMLRHGKTAVFQATLPPQVTSLNTADECWELFIHLPNQLRQQPAVPHYFHARLEGRTDHYPADSVALTITPTPQDETLAMLERSNFRAESWNIRPTARHSKSKTYSQSPD